MFTLEAELLHSLNEKLTLYAYRDGSQKLDKL